MKFSELEDGQMITHRLDNLDEQLRSLKLDVREARLEAREQYNRFRLLIWLPIITGVLQVLAVILHR